MSISEKIYDKTVEWSEIVTMERLGKRVRETIADCDRTKVAKLARLDSPGVLHHVMIRGIERRNIFRDNGDRNDFIERLSFLLPKTKTLCYAWAFMSNHAHVLFRSGFSGIAYLMRKLLTGYVSRNEVILFMVLPTIVQPSIK